MGEKKFCYKCMEQYDALRAVCPNCGHHNSETYDTMYIAPGTILRERYLVGNLIEYNGEGANYIGFDKTTGCKVVIREYMPITLCTRVKGKPTISVNYNNLAKYKAFMAEYTELNKAIARLRNNANIVPVLDMIAENNTTYTIFEYTEGKKLLEYLKENAGELSWNQISKLFPPLFTTIGILHNAGLTHRAISPDTIYINDKGELKLTGFCVSAVRTANAGLEFELFKGYAAPEQYSPSTNSRQGSWTDVYSVCALLYRMLTGCMPTDSLARLEHDDLCEPIRLNANIPPHVSRIIMEGMNLSGKNRIQTITELVTKLFEQSPNEEIYREPYYEEPRQPQPLPQPNYGYQSTDAYERTPYDSGNYSDYNNVPDYGNYNDYDDSDYEEDYRYESVSTVDKIKVPIIIGILMLVILLIIAAFCWKIFFGDTPGSDTSTPSLSSSMLDNVVDATADTTEEATTEGNSVMFDLTNKVFDMTKDKYKDYFELVAVYEYNDTIEKDRIFDQDVKPDQPFTRGQKITVKVSKGKAVAIIPEYKNLTASQYETELKKAGVTAYEMIPQLTASSGVPNSVLMLQVDGKTIKAGDQFNNEEGKKLYVYFLSKDAEIKTEPPTQAPTEAPRTEAPTQAPTEAPTQVPPPSTEAQNNNPQQENPQQPDNQDGNSPEYG